MMQVLQYSVDAGLPWTYHCLGLSYTGDTCATSREVITQTWEACGWDSMYKAAPCSLLNGRLSGRPALWPGLLLSAIQLLTARIPTAKKATEIVSPKCQLLEHEPHSPSAMAMLLLACRDGCATNAGRVSLPWTVWGVSVYQMTSKANRHPFLVGCLSWQ